MDGSTEKGEELLLRQGTCVDASSEKRLEFLTQNVFFAIIVFIDISSLFTPTLNEFYGQNARTPRVITIICYRRHRKTNRGNAHYLFITEKCRRKSLKITLNQIKLE